MFSPVCVTLAALPCEVPNISHATTDAAEAVVYFGDTVTVNCDTGYVLSGGTNPMICGANQTFADVPLCEGKSAGLETNIPMIFWFSF